MTAGVIEPRGIVTSGIVIVVVVVRWTTACTLLVDVFPFVAVALGSAAVILHSLPALGQKLWTIHHVIFHFKSIFVAARSIGVVVSAVVYLCLRY